MHSLITWFARHSVAANLLMVAIIAWGLSSLAGRITLEVFPSFELDSVSIQVAYPGASPQDIEQALIIPIEQAIAEIAGITTLRSNAVEGLGSVVAQVDSGYETQRVRNEIEQAVAAIGSFPEEIERPDITIPLADREVIGVVISADLPALELRGLADALRQDLENLPGISSVRLSAGPDFELAIDIAQATLDRYGLTLAEVSQAIESSSISRALGVVNTASGELLLRTRQQASLPDEFGNIPVLVRSDGTRIRLQDIARIQDGFDDSDWRQNFNGIPSVELDVYRTGQQSALQVAATVKNHLQQAQQSMPYGVTLGYWRDWSRTLKARLDTLVRSAVQGGILVLLLLSLFLRFRVAFWVMAGVPVCMLGALALMPLFGVSLNLLTLFAFILVLGIVVDDAIVTGENIHTRMQRSGAVTRSDRVQAAIDGTHEVAVPVTLGVMTTMVAFSPLLMIDGARGQVFAQIPLVVIPVLLFSIIESKLILPAHLSHTPGNRARAQKPGRIGHWQQRIAAAFERFVLDRYQPFLMQALQLRYLVLAIFVGMALVIYTLISTGHIRFVFFPRVQAETARGTLEMPAGTPFEILASQIERMEKQAMALQARYIDPETGQSVIESIMSRTGISDGSAGVQTGQVIFEIVPPEERSLSVSSQELVDQWREAVGPVPGARRLRYSAEIGQGGEPVNVRISGVDLPVLQSVASRIRQQLITYEGVREIADSLEGGREELSLQLGPAATQLGLNLSDVARQVRSAYAGISLQSVQRGRNEVSVVLRYPIEERSSLAQLRRLSIQTPAGNTVPLASVADFSLQRGYAQISRIDQRRTLNVTADVDKQSVNMEVINEELRALAMTLERQNPSVDIELGGEAREQRESFASLKVGLVFVLLAIYTLLAIPFGSYVQPLIVMLVIPFGVIGGVLGHLLMGMPLSIMSYMGMLALCGVVVNDSLVLVDWVNRQRRRGMRLIDAVQNAGVARFRAVILTSLTTFFGLLPLIFENATQAQFLVPMAVSLGYGILFATLITLVLVPVNYMVLEDIRTLWVRTGEILK